jgi:hypothetical protein
MNVVLAILGLLALLVMGAGMNFAYPSVKDALLKVTRALPAAASATVNSSGIDLGALSASGARIELAEILISAPAVTTTMVPDTKTITYSVQMDDDSAFGSPTTLLASAIVQTGAGGAGAAAATRRIKIPSNCERYIRLVAVSGADVTDSSSVSATMEVLT